MIGKENGQEKDPGAAGLIRAYEEFWNAYEIHNGHESVLLSAKRCRSWFLYYQNQAGLGKITKEQCREKIEEKLQMTLRQAERKIRLLSLIPELQTRVNLGTISESAAYELSFLKKSYQHQLSEIIRCEHLIPSFKQAQQLRTFTFADWYHGQSIRNLLRH